MSNSKNIRKQDIVFVDRIYKYVMLPAILRAFINRREFAALKEKLQLGPVKYYFPQARHTRYEHSIGAAGLAYIAVKSIAANQPLLSITESDIICVTLAALYHDIGHGPYSHMYDHMLEDQKFPYITAKHEARSIMLFDYIVRCLKQDNIIDMSDLEVEKVKYFIDPKLYKSITKNEPPEHIAGLSEIVNNCYCQLDVDKMDYIMRDSQTLLPQQDLGNNIDIIAILKRSMLINDHWTFHASDDLGIRGIFAKRFRLYEEVYFSKRMMAIDYLISELIVSMSQEHREIIECARLSNQNDIDAFCELTDEYIDDLLLNSEADTPHMQDIRLKMMQIIKHPDSAYTCIADYAAIDSGEIDSGEEKDNRLYENMSNIPNFFLTKNKLASDKSDICTVISKIPFYYKNKDGEIVVARADRIKRRDTIFVSKLDRL
jgi:HD superfamily phosphohydrolase